MKKVVIITTVTALAASVWGVWVYEGKWGSYRTGNGRFYHPYGIDIAPNDNVYVAEDMNHRVQYFKDIEHAVAPTSLGKVKALFR